jgi:TonB family protein
MFNNLIESRSHKREFQRRGSFLLYTITGYSLLFLVGGIASIYAYDAHLEEHESEIVIMLPPVQPESPSTARENQPLKSTSGGRGGFKEPNRTASTSQPIVPSQISTAPFLAVPTNRLGDTRNKDFQSGSGLQPQIGFDGGSGQPGKTAVEIDTPPPPPVVVRKQVPQVIKASTVLNGRAKDLPKPLYPAIARQVRASGLVSVQVLIDEHGKVVSAQALQGHPFLIPSAVKAAYQARFSPTLVGDTPVKVSGIINYNFVLQ